MVGGSSTLWHTCRSLVSPKPCRYDILSLGVGAILSELAASDEIGGLLSRSDSLENVLLWTSNQRRSSTVKSNKVGECVPPCLLT